MTKLFAATRTHGAANLFYTVAPDDVHLPLAIRLAHKHVDAAQFPAQLTDDVLAAMRGRSAQDWFRLADFPMGESTRSSRDVFALEKLDAAGLASFDVAYRALLRALPPRREATVFLEVATDLAMLRVASRGRPEEEELSREFHHALRARHDDLYLATAHARHRVDATRAPALVADAVATLAEALIDDGRRLGSPVGCSPTTAQPWQPRQPPADGWPPRRGAACVTAAGTRRAQGEHVQQLTRT